MIFQNVKKEMKITLKKKNKTTPEGNLSIRHSTTKSAQKQEFEGKIYKVRCVDTVSGFGRKSIYELSGAILEENQIQLEKVLPVPFK